MSMRPTDYSTASRAYHGPVASTGQEDLYAPVGGHFTVSKLLQTDVLNVVREEPIAPPTIRTGYEVSLSASLKGIYRSVGMVQCDYSLA